MAWTDDRVDLLKKYWAEGLSASQIALRLGEVTRNAVIGKVHRLGLSGRATTSRMKSARPRRMRTGGRVKTNRSSFGNGGLKSVFRGDATQKNNSGYQTYVELVIPPEERKTIQTLTECSCRWPIGDPVDKEFHFCGKDKVPGMPYCEFHAAIAFQPAQTRRRDRERQQPVAANSN